MTVRSDHSENRRILFIDDELPERGATLPPFGDVMSYYVQALCDSGFEVVKCHTVEELPILAKQERYSVIILDIMMPPGQEYSPDETWHGLRTGITVAHDLEEICPGTPIIILTNVRMSELLAQVNKLPNVARVFSKEECPPLKLVAEINSVMRER